MIALLNAFACALWVKVDNVWWMWKRYYYSGRETGRQLTDSEYADAVCELVAPVFDAQRQAMNKGHILEEGKMEAIIDPSAASFITELARRKMFKTRHADNKVGDGIRNTNTAIKRGIIKVDESIDEWPKEAGGYVWEKDKEEPVKENDHLMDSTRYFVRTKKLGRIKIIDDGNMNYSTEDVSNMLNYF